MVDDLEQSLDSLEQSFLSSLDLTDDINGSLMTLWGDGVMLGEESALYDIVTEVNKVPLSVTTPNEEIKRMLQIAAVGLLPVALGARILEIIANLRKDGVKPNEDRARMALIARTELTKALNHGRDVIFNKSPLVTHVLFSSIMDKKTTTVCKSRNGMVLKVGSPEYYANSPSLHFNCRSYFKPLLPSLNPRHLALVEDPSRSPSKRVLEPLMKGWSTGIILVS